VPAHFDILIDEIFAENIILVIENTRRDFETDAMLRLIDPVL